MLTVNLSVDIVVVDKIFPKLLISMSFAQGNAESR